MRSADIVLFLLFGYDYVDGKLKINPERAEIVKQIFTWYVSGIGMNEIATRLNKLNVRKEIWRRGTIHCILTNEKYIGDTLLQKTFTTDTLPYKGVINRGEKEQYYVSGTLCSFGIYFQLSVNIVVPERG